MRKLSDYIEVATHYQIQSMIYPNFSSPFFPLLVILLSPPLDGCDRVLPLDDFPWASVSRREGTVRAEDDDFSFKLSCKSINLFFRLLITLLK